MNLAELMNAKGLFDVRRTNLIPHGDRTQRMAGTPGMLSGQVLRMLQADGCTLCPHFAYGISSTNGKQDAQYGRPAYTSIRWEWATLSPLPSTDPAAARQSAKSA